MTSIAPIKTGRVNWIGLNALVKKECARFMNVWAQTVLTPVISSLLFFTVFALAFGGAERMVEDVPFMTFLAPGLLMMAMMQNAFANTSSSLMISKIQGNIVDILMPPLMPLELLTGFVIGGVARGLLIGLVGALPLAYIADFGLVHIWAALYFALSGSLALALLGVLGGVWAEKFDHLATITNFLIMPLTFLSGTFYAISALPEFWYNIAMFNPFFYVIDGFRYGLLGQSETSVLHGVIMLLIVNLGLFSVTWYMLHKGYKIKA